MKTYGKEPESLSSITATMLSDLSEFPPESILRAFKTHAQRNQEFPTTADIIGLIKRNGRPPLKESDIIAIRKKEVCDWTRAEAEMVEEWQAQQQDGWRDFADPLKDEATLQENLRLRGELGQLRQEVRRLTELLAETRREKRLDPPKPSHREKVENTIRAMKAEGAPAQDIQLFAESQGMADLA